jgi:hypothetical protein
MSLPSDEDIHVQLSEFLLTLEGTGAEIYALHCRLLSEPDLYLACWSHLDAPFRARWKSYLEDFLNDRSRESGERLSLPSAD